MAKKKMTTAQAAAARRPDDWEPPQTAPKETKAKKAKNVNLNNNYIKEYAKKDSGYRGLFIFFIILFVVMAIVTPFIIIFVSNLLGIQSA